jgi:hypothetical protein
VFRAAPDNCPQIFPRLLQYHIAARFQHFWDYFVGFIGETGER